MDEQIKQRLVGAVVLVVLAVIFVPMLLAPPGEMSGQAPALPPTPQRPGSSDGFSSRIVPLGTPRVADVAVAPPAGAEAMPDAVPEPAALAAPNRAVRRDGAAEGDWVVQLGSFSNARNAAALRDRLIQKGYAAFTRTAKGERGDITRVYVGPEPDRAGADRAVRSLEKDTRLRGIVVRNPKG